MYIANSRATTKESERGMLRKERKWNQNVQLKPHKAENRVEDKNRNYEEGQQIENTNKYGRY